ncbi:hypothetical protein NL676_038721 [Syzygium grande]|nr:hypothetical protein NL676_038721 [Syzygium grande]
MSSSLWSTPRSESDHHHRCLLQQLNQPLSLFYLASFSDDWRSLAALPVVASIVLPSLNRRTFLLSNRQGTTLLFCRFSGALLATHHNRDHLGQTVLA